MGTVDGIEMACEWTTADAPPAPCRASDAAEFASEVDESTALVCMEAAPLAGAMATR
jgi:hypothetical protein